MKRKIVKKEILRIHIAAVLCAVLGWWGLLYPELTLTPDTVRVISREGEETQLPEGELYLELLKAERGSICYRSRLLTELSAFWEAFSWDKSTEN